MTNNMHDDKGGHAGSGTAWARSEGLKRDHTRAFHEVDACDTSLALDEAQGSEQRRGFGMRSQQRKKTVPETETACDKLYNPRQLELPYQSDRNRRAWARVEKNA